jgi:hypothetical protein
MRRRGDDGGQTRGLLVVVITAVHQTSGFPLLLGHAVFSAQVIFLIFFLLTVYSPIYPKAAIPALSSQLPRPRPNPDELAVFSHLTIASSPYAAFLSRL